MEKKLIGVNLTGGGARGAYQAGSLKALAEILDRRGCAQERSPLKVWSGVSAGSINSAFCAAHSHDLKKGTEKLADLWEQLSPEQVYKTDFVSLGANSFRWIRDLSLGSLAQKKAANSLLNTQPLLKLLKQHIPFEQIGENLRREVIHAVTCSAHCYNDSNTVTFVQSNRDFHWRRTRRYSQSAEINANHILASCSIPILFPPTHIDGQFYADGGFRNTTPVSPTINMGAQKILMIGVRYCDPEAPVGSDMAEPGIGRVAGSVLNALFFDALDVDLERIQHINDIVNEVDGQVSTSRSEYITIDYKVLRPTENISEIARECSENAFPRMVQFLLDGLGARSDNSDLASYILFDSRYTRPLVELGYKDLMLRKDEVEAWLFDKS